jgi:serine beta-lactamase-like protein LACTB
MRFLNTACTALLFLPLAQGASAAAPAAPALSVPAAIDAKLTGLFSAKAPGAAVLVMKDGATIVNRGYGLANVELHVPMQPGQVFNAASVGKQFTAAAILTLAEAGKLKLTDRLSAFFPDAPRSWDGITVAHLLQHTSGIPNLFLDAGFRQQAFEAHTPAQLLAAAATKPLLAPPGSGFAYASVNYTLLAMIVEQRSGEPYQDYVARRFFGPLGMRDTHFISNDSLIDAMATPYEEGPRLAVRWHSTLGFGGGGVATNNADLARWTLALQSGKVLQDASLQAMNTALTLADGKRVPYGYGIRPHTLAGQPYLESNGDVQGFHAEVVYLPLSKVFVSILSNGEGVLRYGLQPLAKRIATIAAGMPQYAPAARALPVAALRRLAGTYVRDKEQYVIAVRDGKLQVQYPAGASWAALDAVSPTEFFYEGSRDVGIRFASRADGKQTLQWFEIDALDDAADPVFVRE